MTVCQAASSLGTKSSQNVTSLMDTAQAFRRIQNGSDIRGVAMSVPGEEVTLTPAVGFFIGKAFGHWLMEKTKRDQVKVVVGQDPRLSAALLKSVTIAGLISAGVAVDDVGLSTTPAMFYGLVMAGSSYAGSIMLTASHMPFQNNGLKFFTKEGGLAKTDIAEILDLAAQMCISARVVPGYTSLSDMSFVLQQSLILDYPSCCRITQLLPRYADHLKDLIQQGINHPDHYDTPLRGLKVVVDAGNGSGGFFADQVLAPLGADVTGSQYLEPDGTFPNHVPNPEHPSAMAAGRQAVLKAKADLGLVFDTDVDRSAIVDRNGCPINGNKFIALMAAIILKDHPGTTVVTDSVTSNGLTEFIHRLGGKHFRYKRGYKNVIAKGMELNQEGVDCQLMMETSGHGALAENYFLDDGAYLAVKVLVETVRRKLAGEDDLTDLLRDLREPVEAQEYRIKILDPKFKPVAKQVVEAFHEWVTSGQVGPTWQVEEVNHEGWRVNVDEGEGRKGWLLLRSSLHDPLLVLNVESDKEGGVAEIRKAVLKWFSSMKGLPLDLKVLQSPS